MSVGGQRFKTEVSGFMHRGLDSGEIDKAKSQRERFQAGLVDIRHSTRHAACAHGFRGGGSFCHWK